MYRVVSQLLILLLCAFVFSAGDVCAARNKTLVTIDGTVYTNQDYRTWWSFWREPGMAFYDSPQEFIDFHLLAEQGRHMELHLSPDYQRKVFVFLKVRALAALKKEEVDSKIKISEEQIKVEFEKEYSPVWNIQVLSYDEEAKAKTTFEKLQGFNGQKAGRLVFADLGGVKPDDGGAVAYEDVEVNPLMIAKVPESDKWLKAISGLDKGFVSEPLFLEKSGRYIVIRLDDITFPGKEVFAEKKATIRKKMEKKEISRLTGELMERLTDKYHVRIDDELSQSVTMDGDYPKDFLMKKVVEMDGGSLSVEMLIYNMKRQQPLRMTLPEDRLKNGVINAFISNYLTDTEALSRHYEKKQPIKGIYEFYKDNTLIKFLNARIKERLVVEDSEVEDYFNLNQAEFTRPERISYLIIEEQKSFLMEISKAVSQGADFFDQARERSFDPQIKTMEVDSIRPELAVELAKLQKGETGKPFPYESGYAMLKLIDRVESKVAPFDDKMRGMIKKTLSEKKYAEAKAVYLEKAQSLAQVKVNQRVWNKLKKEYNNANNL